MAAASLLAFSAHVALVLCGRWVGLPVHALELAPPAEPAALHWVEPPLRSLAASSTPEPAKPEAIQRRPARGSRQASDVALLRPPRFPERVHETARGRPSSSDQELPTATPREPTQAGAAPRAAAASPGTLRAGSASPRRASLLSSSAACAGLFPAAATSAAGVVTVAVHVAADGRASFQRLVDELPRDQGFGWAARVCTDRLRFQPARDDRGARSASSAVVKLTFSRRAG